MNEILKKGDSAPEFSLKNKDGKPVSLENFKGKWLVLYFYPMDNTPGCTKEAVEFTEMVSEFEKENAQVIGISPDSEKSHLKFSERKQLKIELLSDPEHEVLKKYGVWKPKKLFGKEFLGVVRSTFLINPEGIIEKIWDKVKVTGHATDVKENLCSLK
jgi:peroxiredoxin